MNLFNEDIEVEAARAAAEAELLLRERTPGRLSDAGRRAHEERIAAYEAACDALWSEILRHIAAWYIEQVNRALYERRLVADLMVLDQVRDAAMKAAQRMRKQLADAAKTAAWIEATDYFSPLRPNASLPSVLDGLGRLVAEPLPSICALASLPAPLGANPLRNETWPSHVLEWVSREVHSAGGALGQAGADASVAAAPGTFATTVRERRAVPHPVIFAFVAAATAASRLSGADVAIALAERR
ncbi:MAG: hypothetical protein KGK07_16195 [Chloroflexota bacterium]|nr:hypothetical protein [Chloroflexota bacterium]